MKFARRVAVAVNLNQPLPEVFKTLKNLEFLGNCEIHVIYSYLTISYLVGLGETALVYPLEADRKKVEESVNATLQDYSQKIFPAPFGGKIITRCLFSDDPKRAFCDYIKEENVDLVIVATREKKGLFESSFTQFVNKHTNANMIVLKHSA